MCRLVLLVLSFLLVSNVVLAVPPAPTYGNCGVYSRGMRVENFSKGGTFNLSAPKVVAPAVGHVNMTGNAPLVGYYTPANRHKYTNHNGQIKNYDRKTVTRSSENKTQYRKTTRKTQYKNAQTRYN